MGRAFGEQIAVLDGLDEGSSSIDYDTSESDGRIGQMRADAKYGRAQVTGRGPAGIISTRRGMVIDASAGANYSGGSSYAPRLPLLPSTVGLAAIPSVLPTRRNVIDFSGGANYSGGSSWTGGIPLTPSNSGLAAANGLGDEGYGRAGLGGSHEGYGRAGLGAPMPGADSDLAGAFAAIELGAMDPNDGRIGQTRPGVAYGRNVRMVAPNTLIKMNVIDPSGGANYTGGSDYAPGMPLLVSSIGLAGLDGMTDRMMGRAIAKLRRAGVGVNRTKVLRSFGKSSLDRLKMAAMRIQRIWDTLSPMQKASATQALKDLGIVRTARANLLRASAQV